MNRVASFFSGTGILLILSGLFLQGVSCKKESGDQEPGLYGSWVDTVDGAVYRTIRLGDQFWIADNINRGEMINGSTDQKDNGIIEKYCYDNNPVLCEKYGGLYQWGEAVQYDKSESSQGICPTGWHVPSDSEWKILEIHLGMPGEAVADLLWRGIDHGFMIQPDGETGFEALRSGNRTFRGGFIEIGSAGYFWTSTIADDGHAWRRGVSINHGGIYRSKNLKSFGFSVRCLKY